MRRNSRGSTSQSCLVHLQPQSLQLLLCQILEAEKIQRSWEGRGSQERAKQTLQLSPRDCLECNVPLHPLSFSPCNFLHRKNTMENISQTLQSLLLTPAARHRNRLGRGGRRSNFFPPRQRFQRWKLRNPVTFGHCMMLRGFGMICPGCSELSKFQQLFSLPGGWGSTMGFALHLHPLETMEESAWVCTTWIPNWRV